MGIPRFGGVLRASRSVLTLHPACMASEKIGYNVFPVFPVTGPVTSVAFNVDTATNGANVILTGSSYSARVQVSNAISKSGPAHLFIPPDASFSTSATITQATGPTSVPGPFRFIRIVLDSGTLTGANIEEQHSGIQGITTAQASAAGQTAGTMAGQTAANTIMTAISYPTKAALSTDATLQNNVGAFTDGSRWVWKASGTVDGGIVIAAAGGGVRQREAGVTVSPQMFGAVPGTDASAQIQAALNSALVTTVAIDATYTASGLSVPAGKALVGAGGKLVGPANAPVNTIIVEIPSNGTVSGLEIDGNKPNTTASGTVGIHSIGVGARVLGNTVYNCGQAGIWMHASDATWGAVRDYLVSGNSVSNCNSQGIILDYTTDGRVTSNRVNNCAQGIQWWGGDGNLTLIRHTARLTISGNNVTNVVGGGIWGSCGSSVTVSGNNVNTCGDVGVDYEGTSGACTGNNISECTNGGITAFFNSSDVNISGNTVIQSGAMGINAHGVWLPSNSLTNRISIIGNTLSINGSGVGIYCADKGSAGDVKVHGNTISTQTAQGIYALHADAWDVQGNTIIQANTGTGIQVDGGNRWKIERNTIKASADAVAGTDKGGIFLNQKTDIPAFTCQGHVVRGNTVQGYGISINDNAYADKSSFSLIADNGVTTNIRKPAASYQGVTTGNFVYGLPASAAAFTTF